MKCRVGTTLHNCLHNSGVDDYLSGSERIEGTPSMSHYRIQSSNICGKNTNPIHNIKSTTNADGIAFRLTFPSTLEWFLMFKNGIGDFATNVSGLDSIM